MNEKKLFKILGFAVAAIVVVLVIFVLVFSYL